MFSLIKNGTGLTLTIKLWYIFPSLGEQLFHFRRTPMDENRAAALATALIYFLLTILS